MLRLFAQTERRRKDAIYVGAAFAGDNNLLYPERTSGVEDEERYESMKEKHSDFWSN